MRRGNKRIIWAIIIIMVILMLPFITIGDDREWTDFSPQPEEAFDKENYRVYYEDKELVMMVLGGVEWWNTNCGTLSGPGEYFINKAIAKHEIDSIEVKTNVLFQTGHFAAALYNDCDIFLDQVDSIGLRLMFMRTLDDTIPETDI